MTSLRDQLRATYERRGALTPAIVVEEARPDDAPLHAHFEWDDAVAGEKYRLHQAAQLIRSVQITYKPADETGPEKKVREWFPVREPDSEQSSYRPTEEIVADPLARQILLRDCEREWRAFKAKYGQLKEFAEIVGRAEDAA